MIKKSEDFVNGLQSVDHKENAETIEPEGEGTVAGDSEPKGKAKISGKPLNVLKVGDRGKRGSTGGKDKGIVAPEDQLNTEGQANTEAAGTPATEGTPATDETPATAGTPADKSKSTEKPKSENGASSKLTEALIDLNGLQEGLLQDGIYEAVCKMDTEGKPVFVNLSLVVEPPDGQMTA